MNKNIIDARKAFIDQGLWTEDMERDYQKALKDKQEKDAKRPIKFFVDGQGDINIDYKNINGIRASEDSKKLLRSFPETGNYKLQYDEVNHRITVIETDTGLEVVSLRTDYVWDNEIMNILYTFGFTFKNEGRLSEGLNTEYLARAYGINESGQWNCYNLFKEEEDEDDCDCDCEDCDYCDY